ncbi:unnamed protein product [Ectocarpus sp. CCAP 1310/34]|nr:unnamed protein product [Ectocarpus sp. CCAP 1310/34]
MIGTYHEARFWCNLDACGILCVLATWSMLLFSVYMVTSVLLRPTPFEQCLSAPKVLTSLAFVSLAAVAATAHVRTMLTNPGAVPRDAAPPPPDTGGEEEGGVNRGGRGEEEDNDLETSRLTKTPASSSSGAVVAAATPPTRGSLPPEGRGGALLPTSSAGQRRERQEGEGRGEQQRALKWCYKCDAFKPARAHHCSLCQRCIVKMDHHCPWVNNCVGIGNQKLFLLFCAYTCALCVFALMIELVVVVLIGDDRRLEECRLSPSDHAATVALTAISIMFGLFTCCMACDQCQVASTNQTKIDRLKGEVHDSVDGGANEVFGGMDGQKCRCHWVLPLPARFPEGDAAARIFGYCTGKRGRGRDGGGQTRALASGGGDGGDASDLGGVELAEYGGLIPSSSSSNGRHAAAGDGGGGGKGDLYATPEAEAGLRHSAGRSLGERLADSRSEGEYR